MPKQPKYSESSIYKLCCKDPTITGMYYVGSTTNFRQRKRQHKHSCTELNLTKSTTVPSISTFVTTATGTTGIWLRLMRNIMLRRTSVIWKEENWNTSRIRATLNQYVPTRTYREYVIDNKEVLAQRRKQYYEKNKETILAKQRKYGLKNKERICARSKTYRLCVWWKTKIHCKWKRSNTTTIIKKNLRRRASCTEQTTGIFFDKKRTRRSYVNVTWWMWDDLLTYYLHKRSQKSPQEDKQALATRRRVATVVRWQTLVADLSVRTVRSP